MANAPCSADGQVPSTPRFITARPSGIWTSMTVIWRRVKPAIRAITWRRFWRLLNSPEPAAANSWPR